MKMKNWDSYWLSMCDVVSSNSKCLSRMIGVVIVRDNKFIVTSGYNGPVMGVIHCSDINYRKYIFNLYIKEGGEFPVGAMSKVEICPRRIMGYAPKASSGIEYCQAAHAERNAIDIAARLGESVKDCVMYLNCGIPCLECAKSIVQSGIKEVVVIELVPNEKRGITGEDILLNGGVKIRKYEN